ncbi:MAG: alpha/beta hydrolase [Actinobacteria bacterium]|nr:alpha/beta hydrolase [Actinomycetota bacterium]
MSFTPFHRGGEGPPLLLLHGFTDTWRTWELVLPTLERRFEVLAPTLAGHAGGPSFSASGASDAFLVDAVEAALDEAGWEAPAIAGNSLGGFVGLRLAERGRARSVAALAPAGGWADDDPAATEILRYFRMMSRMVRDAAPRADQIAATPEGRAAASAAYASTAEHISPDLLAHLIRGAAACDSEPLVTFAEREGWQLEPERIGCPVRLVWGTDDKLLPLAAAAVRFRTELPAAEWIEIDGGGHCPQLDHPVETAELIAGFSG